MLPYCQRGLLLFVLFTFSRTLAAQKFPTAAEIATEMTIGWNIGNTLEALYELNGEIIAEETAWGNPKITRRLLDSVRAAGFNTVRLPIAWDSHATDGVIDPTWLDRVQEVVDMCYEQNLYVIINIHWDNGWLEENVTRTKREENNRKQGLYWGQISERFRSYDHHLLFASANEPNVDNAAQMSVLLSYHQTFIDTVRATGGNNAERTLIIQGPRTDIELTCDLMTTLPTDSATDKLMVEVHFYPFQFTLMTEDASWGNQFFYWGECNKSSSDSAHNPTWGEEDFVDEMFGRMKTKFVDQGYPVILGEYGARKRTNLSGQTFALHQRSREYYLKYVTKAARRIGLIPIYWGAGLSDLFNRSTGGVREPADLNAMMAGAYSIKETVNCSEVDCSGTAFGHAYLNACRKCVTGGNIECTTNTTDQSSITGLHPYPNPTTGLLTVANPEWTLFNGMGQALLRKSRATTIDISEFPAGVYYLKTTGKVYKIVKH